MVSKEHPRNHVIAMADPLVAVACVLGSKLAVHELVGAMLFEGSDLPQCFSLLHVAVSSTSFTLWFWVRQGTHRGSSVS